MIRDEFVKKIIERVRNSAIYAMETNLNKPSGRNPDKKLLEMSQWYHSLEESDRVSLKTVLTDSIDEAIFGFLCVLDGSRDIKLDGTLELILRNDKLEKIINKGDMDLHDIYQSMTEE
jgi:hypothetical protein